MRAIFTRSSSRKVKLFIRCCPCSEHALQHALQHAPQHAPHKANELLLKYPPPPPPNLKRFQKHILKLPRRPQLTVHGHNGIVCFLWNGSIAVSYTHLRAHETKANLVCR